MTRVDFYILQEKGSEARLRFACRLIEKARKQGNQLFVAVANQEEAKKLDHLLWHQAPESFIPHAILNEGEQSPAVQAPTLIGYGESCADHHDTLINLSEHIPAFFSQFQRLSEIVVQDEEVLDRTRSNWKYYRDRGYPLHRHAIR